MAETTPPTNADVGTAARNTTVKEREAAAEFRKVPKSMTMESALAVVAPATLPAERVVEEKDGGLWASTSPEASVMLSTAIRLSVSSGAPASPTPARARVSCAECRTPVKGSVICVVKETVSPTTTKGGSLPPRSPDTDRP